MRGVKEEGGIPRDNRGSGSRNAFPSLRIKKYIAKKIFLELLKFPQLYITLLKV